MRILKHDGGFIKLSSIDAMNLTEYSNGTKVVRIFMGGEHIDLKVRTNAIGSRKIEKVMEIAMSYEK